MSSEWEQTIFNKLLVNGAKDKSKDKHSGHDDCQYETEEHALVGSVTVRVDHHVTGEVIFLISRWDSIRQGYIDQPFIH